MRNFWIVFLMMVAASPLAAAEKGKVPPPSAPQDEAGPVQRKALRTEYKEWGPNPFKVAETEEPLDFTLEGIVMDPEAPYAIINGELRKAGEEFDGAVVTHIDATSVTIKKGKREVTLNLFNKQ